MTFQPRRLGLCALALAALAWPSSGQSQAPRANLPTYTAPAPGTSLGDGQFTVFEASWARGCLVYGSQQRTMFFLNGHGVSDLQGGAERLSLVLEQQPGGNACPQVHPQSGMPLGKLRAPIEFNPNTGGYTIHLLDRTCVGPLGQFNCTRLSR